MYLKCSSEAENAVICFFGRESANCELDDFVLFRDKVIGPSDIEKALILCSIPIE